MPAIPVLELVLVDLFPLPPVLLLLVELLVVLVPLEPVFGAQGLGSGSLFSRPACGDSRWFAENIYD